MKNIGPETFMRLSAHKDQGCSPIPLIKILIPEAIRAGQSPLDYAKDMFQNFGETGKQIARSLFPGKNDEFFEESETED